MHASVLGCFTVNRSGALWFVGCRRRKTTVRKQKQTNPLTNKSPINTLDIHENHCSRQHMQGKVRLSTKLGPHVRKTSCAQSKSCIPKENIPQHRPKYTNIPYLACKLVETYIRQSQHFFFLRRRNITLSLEPAPQLLNQCHVQPGWAHFQHYRKRQQQNK